MKCHRKLSLKSQDPFSSNWKEEIFFKAKIMIDLILYSFKIEEEFRLCRNEKLNKKITI